MVYIVAVSLAAVRSRVFDRDGLAVVVAAVGFVVAVPLAYVQGRFVVVVVGLVVALAAEPAAERVAERPPPPRGRWAEGQEGMVTGLVRRAVARAAVRALLGSGAAWFDIRRRGLRRPIAFQEGRVPLHLCITRTEQLYLERKHGI